ncbi:tyrosine-type recombinase/integrase [Streptomyces ardesiacus]
MSTLTLEPGTTPLGVVRMKRDRLEILHALITAPTFDPLLASDVISVPGDHAVFGWACAVEDCERGRNTTQELCSQHGRDWKRWRDEGGAYIEFLRTARPLTSAMWRRPPACLICPDIPAITKTGVCHYHADRWRGHRLVQTRAGREADFDRWLLTQRPRPGLGKCRVVACGDDAGHPEGMCSTHRRQYIREGRPGQLHVGRHQVTFADERAFHDWCARTAPARRMNGQLSLLGLRPLARAEIKWSLFHHAHGGAERAIWPLSWVQHVADECRRQNANSLADLDTAEVRDHQRAVAHTMLRYLRYVYFTRQDTKEAGYIDGVHYGVDMTDGSAYFDLSDVSQRWLRDLLWHWVDARLTDDPPRSKSPFRAPRRGCTELSAFLEVHAPNGGHDSVLLTKDHMVDFIVDQRHRAQHGLPALGTFAHRNGTEPAIVTDRTAAQTLNGVRRVLRDSMDAGRTELIGLHRTFVVAVPTGKEAARKARRPFDDDVARALAAEANLAALAQLDVEDRGLQDIWEALVFTGRRCSEVLKLRLDCISRLNKVPMFWHDQTKVGNFDAAIRIPERLYQRIEARQAKTIDRFVRRHGRQPTAEERPLLALFPSKHSNRKGLKSVSYTWFHVRFRTWIDGLDIGNCVPHQARHTLATNLLRAGANLTHVKRYLGQISERMAEHYVHLSNTDPKLESALQSVWVAGPGAAEPGLALSDGQPMTREQAEALAIDLTRRSTPAEGGFCTFQPVVNGNACPWNMDCHNCDKFVLSGADLIYWHRKREHWRTVAEGSPDPATADYLHDLFEPTARAIDGLEKALSAVGLLDEALNLDLRRPQDYFGRIWNSVFRAQELAAYTEGV